MLIYLFFKFLYIIANVAVNEWKIVQYLMKFICPPFGQKAQSATCRHCWRDAPRSASASGTKMLSFSKSLTLEVYRRELIFPTSLTKLAPKNCLSHLSSQGLPGHFTLSFPLTFNLQKKTTELHGKIRTAGSHLWTPRWRQQVPMQWSDGRECIRWAIVEYTWQFRFPCLGICEKVGFRLGPLVVGLGQ